MTACWSYIGPLWWQLWTIYHVSSTGFWKFSGCLYEVIGHIKEVSVLPNRWTTCLNCVFYTSNYSLKNASVSLSILYSTHQCKWLLVLVWGFGGLPSPPPPKIIHIHGCRLGQCVSQIYSKWKPFTKCKTDKQCVFPLCFCSCLF